MPRTRAGAVCNIPGCPNDAIDGSRCPDHKPKAWATSTRRRRLPSNWRRIRLAAMQRDQHTCRVCGEPATEVDHIAAGDDHSMGNLQALCTPCHQAKTKVESAVGRWGGGAPRC